MLQITPDVDVNRHYTGLTPGSRAAFICHLNPQSEATSTTAGSISMKDRMMF